MTSQLNVDTIKGNETAGSITIQGEGSATINLQQGLCKHWNQFVQSNASVAEATLKLSLNPKEDPFKFAQILFNPCCKLVVLVPSP